MPHRPSLGDIIRLHGRLGFAYIARYHVWKEPLTVRNRTMTKSLHHKTMVEDSTRCSIANADYLLIFRRSGQNTIPVVHPVELIDWATGGPQPAKLRAIPMAAAPVGSGPAAF